MIRLGQYRFDREQAVLHDPCGRPVPLRSQSSRVLAALAEKANKIVSRDQLIEAVWNGRLVTDDSLAQCIRDIRRALGDNAHAVVQTHHRKGYRLVAASEATAKPSIAVLPFAISTADPGQEYMADGIAEDVTSRLGRCRWLRVVARNSAFSFKGQSVDVREIARQLDVRYILEGSLRLYGSRLRITAELVDGGDGRQLWSEQYDRDIVDVFDLQGEIASAIAGTIGPELEMLEAPSLRTAPAVDLGAWDCYQRALWHLYHFTTPELGTAGELLERTIELDPGFASAYARLAYVHVQFGWYGLYDERPMHVARACQLAGEAVRIDPREPIARLSLGRALMLCGEAARGIAELKAAVDLNPSFAQAHFALAQAYCFLDRPDEALAEIGEAVRLSPRDPHFWTFLHVRALAHYEAGALQQAETDARSAIIQPNCTHWPYLILIAVLGRQQRTTEAANVMSDLTNLGRRFSCSDVRCELRFGEHDINSKPFADQFFADLRAAGMPE